MLSLARYGPATAAVATTTAGMYECTRNNLEDAATQRRNALGGLGAHPKINRTKNGVPGYSGGHDHKIRICIEGAQVLRSIGPWGPPDVGSKNLKIFSKPGHIYNFILRPLIDIVACWNLNGPLNTPTP